MAIDPKVLTPTTGAPPLEDALADPALGDVIDRHQGKEARARLWACRVRLEARRFVLPVAGIQGTGKSTLLNALVFDRHVLPIESGETTAVPVEIVYSPSPSRMAKVVRRDGRIVEVPADADSLAPHVDQTRNPGNEQAVEKVVVESASSLLETGMVLVDLPGVGSLTQANADTAVRYLDESVGVLMMLRTVPPLTRSEAIFVGTAWSRLPAAVFVQNRWTDESEAEAEAARKHNEVILGKVAASVHITLEKPIDVHIVVAYNALKGRLSGDEELMRRSGLRGLEDVLYALAKRWPAFVRERIADAVNGELTATLETVRRREADLATDRDQLAREIAAEKQRFEAFMTALRNRSDETKALVAEFRQRESTKLREWKEKARQELRNVMRSKLRAGIVDGPRLESSLTAEQQVVFDDEFSALRDRILLFCDELGDRLRSLGQWQPSSFDATHTVTRPKSLKWENALPLLGGMAGTAGGGAAGVAAGAAIGTAIGVGGGPLGVVIGAVAGAVVGLLGGLLGGWLGKRGAKAKLDSRIRRVEGAVFDAIDRFTEDVRQGFDAQVASLVPQMEQALARWVADQEATFNRDQAGRIAMLGSSDGERRQRLDALRPDEELLVTWLARLQRRAS